MKKSEMPSFDHVILHFENVIGRKISLLVSPFAKLTDIRLLQERLGIDLNKSSFVKRIVKEKQRDEFVQIDTSKTVGEAGLKDDDRIMVIPAMRTYCGPEIVRSDSGEQLLRFFILPEADVEEAIDRILADDGRKRNPDYDYVLISGDIPGKFMVMELPKRSPKTAESLSNFISNADPAPQSSSMERNENQNDEPKAETPPRPLTDRERCEIEKTRIAVDGIHKLREKIRQQKLRQLEAKFNALFAKTPSTPPHPVPGQAVRISNSAITEKMADGFDRGERGVEGGPEFGKQSTKADQREHKIKYPKGVTRKIVKNAQNGEEKRKEEENDKRSS